MNNAVHAIVHRFAATERERPVQPGKDEPAAETRMAERSTK